MGDIRENPLTHGVLLAMKFQFIGKTPVQGDPAQLYMSPMFKPKVIASESYFIHLIENQFRWYRNSKEWFPLETIGDVLALHKIYSNEKLI